MGWVQYGRRLRADVAPEHESTRESAPDDAELPGDRSAMESDPGPGKARDAVFSWFARFLSRLGVRPNHLTLAQIPVYAIMIHAGFQGRLVAFAVWQMLIIVLDGMDGTLARRMGVQSRRGAYLDAVFDLFGIVVVMIVAIYTHPAYTAPLLALFLVNFLLYYQNYRLDEKAVSFVRGPVVLGILAEFYWPGVLSFAIGVPLVATLLILVVRMVKRPVTPPPHVKRGPPPYRPGFKVGRQDD